MDTTQILMLLIGVGVGAVAGVLVGQMLSQRKLDRRTEEMSSQINDLSVDKARLEGNLQSSKSVKEELEAERQLVDELRANITALKTSLEHESMQAQQERRLKEESLNAKDTQISSVLQAERGGLEAEKRALTEGHAAQMAEMKKNVEEQRRAKEEALATKDEQIAALLRAERAGMEAEKRALTEGHTAQMEEMKKNVEEQRRAKEEALATKDEQIAALLRAERAGMEAEKRALTEGHTAQMEEMKKNVEEQRRVLAEAETKLREAFTSLSATALEKAQTQLLELAEARFKQNQEAATADMDHRHKAIETLVKPLEDGLKTLDQTRQEFEKKVAAENAVLQENLKVLLGATEGLSNALRKPQARGSWGEIHLDTVLSSSGLQEGVDYHRQVSTRDGDTQLIADIVIHLPKGRRIIIDAKTSFEPFREYVNAETDLERAALLSKFLSSMRKHMNDLGTKRYQDKQESPDFVLMYVPHESMYYTAIQEDRSLVTDAFSKSVYLANPMTLISLLKSVEYVLQQERMNEGAQAVSLLGKTVYDNLKKYAEHVSKVGTQLRKTVEAYNDSVGSLERRLLPSARRFKDVVPGALELSTEAIVLETMPTEIQSPELTSPKEDKTLFNEFGD